MTKRIVARFRCDAVAKADATENVRLMAVYSDDPSSPNHQWSKWTPAGTLLISISNPAAQGMFSEGKEYELIVSPVGA